VFFLCGEGLSEGLSRVSGTLGRGSCYFLFRLCFRWVLSICVAQGW